MRDTPSQTAFTVAVSLLSLSAHPSHKGAVESDYADQLAKLLCASGQMTSIGAWVWRNPWTARGIRRSFDLAGLPGQFAAFGTRKRFFETQARKSIANGAAQVLVLGAGYDLLCQRLGPEFPDVSFFEVDHPATSQAKRQGVESIGRPPNVGFVAADFAVTSLAKRLAEEPNWDASAMSFVAAEGLTQYLPERAVREMLDAVSRETGTGTEFALTFVGWREAENRAEAGPKTDKNLRRFAARGEPWLWGCERSKFSAFLKDTEWEILVPPTSAAWDNLTVIGKHAS